MKKLKTLGIDEQLVEEVVQAFREGVRDYFEDENVDYCEDHVDDVTNIFIDHWYDICEGQKPEEMRLEQLRDELQDEADHLNVGFIMGMASQQLPAQHPVREAVGKKMERKYSKD